MVTVWWHVLSNNLNKWQSILNGISNQDLDGCMYSNNEYHHRILILIKMGARLNWLCLKMYDYYRYDKFCWIIYMIGGDMNIDESMIAGNVKLV